VDVLMERYPIINTAQAYSIQQADFQAPLLFVREEASLYTSLATLPQRAA
jgi:hypothetical protein